MALANLASRSTLGAAAVAAYRYGGEVGKIVAHAYVKATGQPEAPSEGLAQAMESYSQNVQPPAPNFGPAPAKAGGSGGDKRNTAEQTALIKMAKTDKKTGISQGDAKAYKELGGEAGVKVHGPESHPNRPAPSSREPHIHVGPVNHIPVKAE